MTLPSALRRFRQELDIFPSAIQSALGRLLPPLARLLGNESSASDYSQEPDGFDGVLISDEFTDPHKRQAIHEKRMRKMDGVLPLLPPPAIHGAASAPVTLVGWGSTEGVIREAIQQLAEAGIVANNLQVRWLVPLHADAILSALGKAGTVIVVENNYSGQFARYLRSETSIVADGHIRKYDGEPFMPHHIVHGVKAVLAGEAKTYVPVHEIMV